MTCVRSARSPSQNVEKKVNPPEKDLYTSVFVVLGSRKCLVFWGDLEKPGVLGVVGAVARLIYIGRSIGLFRVFSQKNIWFVGSLR